MPGVTILSNRCDWRGLCSSAPRVPGGPIPAEQAGEGMDPHPVGTKPLRNKGSSTLETEALPPRASSPGSVEHTMRVLGARESGNLCDVASRQGDSKGRPLPWLRLQCQRPSMFRHDLIGHQESQPCPPAFLGRHHLVKELLPNGRWDPCAIVLDLVQV